MIPYSQIIKVEVKFKLFLINPWISSSFHAKYEVKFREALCKILLNKNALLVYVFSLFEC